MTSRRAWHSLTLLPDGTVLAAGGESGRCSGNSCFLVEGASSAELYDPATGTWTATGDMTAPRKTHTATLLNDGTVLMAGGESYVLGTTASAELYVPSELVPVPAVTGLRFDRTSVIEGSSYLANVSGSNLTAQTFFDVRFTSAGSKTSAVVLNWQRGLVASHGVPDGTASGNWTIIGVRAHEIETDHTGNFFPVSATITVSP